MAVCFVILAGVGVIFFLSAGEDLPEEEWIRWQKPFAKAAGYLLRRTKQERTEFTVRRLATVLVVLLVGSGTAFLTRGVQMGSRFLSEGYRLERPGEGQGSRKQELRVQIGERKETEQLEIRVDQRSLSVQEKREVLKQAIAEADQRILGENSSADEVRERVVLPEKLADGRVSASWTWEPYELMDTQGIIAQDIPEEGAVLELRAELECYGQKGIYECVLRLMPRIYTEEERRTLELREKVQQADEKSAEEQAMLLPRELNGESLTWWEPRESLANIFLVLTLTGAAIVWVQKTREKEARQEKRRRQLIMDYPALLFKLSMLLNAGMTMQNAFVKIALEYQRREDKEKRFAYEEMLVSYYEMQSGVPEARAYENFGRRCRENCYLKLGTMLSGNLQKGSEGLAGLLQEEALFSMEERRQMAKRLGEEAGTKLLMPMLLMLLVVLIILMVPAVMSF